MTLDLRVDATQTVEEISKYLRQIVKRNNSHGVILGLSGGLDSCVLAVLAVHALGPQAVTVVYLFDQDSDPIIAQNARLMAKSLGLSLEESDISEDMAKRGVYASIFTKMLRISGAVARVSAASYKLICGETPFKSTLRVGSGETLQPWYKRLMFNLTMHHVDAGFTQRHVFRRDILECIATERNLSLIGAANRSECEVGWFVKDGIDDLEVQPLTGLLKTQVRQLAKELELPEPVRNQLPSPDMARGVTDEFGIGHEYRIIDIVIDGLDRGLAVEEIVALGIPKKDVIDICDLMRLSEWKRTSPHEMPPVSGRYGSNVRG
ncbi:NAD(+) synthase [Halodesulfovibrio marinisediminis]|uniref:NH(3)-dependent NAD(+) synthetase n=1 Tax=Halodesulfovibrio marinisediminis DSM 17456 TaxID=1121457 RepID=A0A1N6DND7_9BACT|nr:NAD(+) synthase [Halodesulfovibrio marinisediminis]SIN72312.1 NAD+ synthase [Halodesulfovibrio marinisediminis DSM 17456]